MNNMSEFEEIAKSLSKLTKNVGFRIDEMAEAFNIAFSSFPFMDDFNFVITEFEEPKMNDYCSYVKNKQCGFGYIIGIGDKTFTLKIGIKRYITVTKDNVKKAIGGEENGY